MTIVAKVEGVRIRRATDHNPDLSYLKDADRYSDVPSAEAERYREADRDRLRDYEQGEWEMLGVQAIAKVRLHLSTHPGGTLQGFEVYSPGLWGVESDSSEEYLASIEREQRDELADILAAIGLRIDGDLSDTQALDAMAAFINEPGPVNGGDFLEKAEGLLVEAGRTILDNAEEFKENA